MTKFRAKFCPHLWIAIGCFWAVQLFSGNSLAQGQTCLKIAYWELDSPEFRAGYEIVQEAYKQAGVCHEFVKIPYKRAAILLQSGEIDANLWRLEEFVQKGNGWLLPIPKAILETRIGLVYNDSAVDPKDLRSSLHNESIGTTRGTVLSDKFIHSLSARKVLVKDHATLFFLLKNSRIKAALLPLEIFEGHKETHQLGPDIKSLTLRKTRVFHVIAKKHQDLVPRLNAAFEQILKRKDFFKRVAKIQ